MPEKGNILENASLALKVVICIQGNSCDAEADLSLGKGWQ